MFSKERKRWFRAFKIAKVLFEGEGYHIIYLNQAEAFIRRRTMYSPKISEELIPVLFRVSRSRRMPMTRLVDQILRDYLQRNGKMEGGNLSHADEKGMGGLQGTEAKGRDQGDPGALRPPGRDAPKQG